MNPQQYQFYNESIQYCDKLKNQLESEKESIRRCFHGDPLKAYIKATDEAIKRVQQIKNTLQSLQSMQQ